MNGQRLTRCKYCGATIAKSAKTCPYCGGRNKKSKALWIILLSIFLVLLFFAVAYNGIMNPAVSDEAESMTEDEFKSACEKMEYDELARNADNLIGKKVRFSGAVQQVVYEGDSFDSQYRVSVTKDEGFDWYSPDTIIYLYYNVGENSRILLNDIITFYGEVIGYEEYTSVSGVSVKVPAVKAVYVSIDK